MLNQLLNGVDWTAELPPMILVLLNCPRGYANTVDLDKNLQPGEKASPSFATPPPPRPDQNLGQNSVTKTRVRPR